MSADTRIAYLILGGLVGFIVGYIVRSLREIKTRVDEVDEHVTKVEKNTDHGFANNSWVTNVAILLSLLLTCYAAFTSQLASNHVQDTQASEKQVTTCVTIYLNDTIVALNARTQFTQDQAMANARLQASQLKLLKPFATHQPATQAERDDSFRAYVGALSDFLDFVGKTNTTVADNPYPTATGFKNCLGGKDS